MCSSRRALGATGGSSDPPLWAQLPLANEILCSSRPDLAKLPDGPPSPRTKGKTPSYVLFLFSYVLLLTHVLD